MADPVAAAEANSREIRVFISSTFRDFMEERRLLATQVFPEINRRARERGVELVEVDLRWGVTQEQVEDGRALEIYLKEIERCRPYFIGMLGDSYGSITPTEQQLLTAAPERVELLEKRQWLAGQLGEISYTALEIGHSLELLRDQQLKGRAFFYFRDSAWSAPKADAGEAGWRSDDPAERQKLELLRSRIRSSGHPLVEGLQSPQAIADQIKEDLWSLIDRQFPEGEQPDALEREERKHADYRRSRTRPGEYVGGEGYIQQLEDWIEEGRQRILITGESGSGKSALIANWMERHSQSHPADVVYAHHLGCTNDANALRPLLGRLIDTASKQLLEAEVIREALAVPEDWWQLLAKVAETLQTLGHWCQQKGKRWIWVLDGLDRLDPDDQKALPWLPMNLPAGVQVVASSLACTAREVLNERGYSTLTIEPLAQAEQEELIQRYLQRYTKELDGGLRQLILSHPLVGSPLFLKVLLEELRQCGRHDTLRQQLDFYLSSETVDDLYERVLERLENDGSGEAVRKVMTALWASRAGLTELELLAITDLKQLQWAPIDLALEKAFGRNGNRLVFDHDYLRIAVQNRYLKNKQSQNKAHSSLAKALIKLGRSNMWHNIFLEDRLAEEYPWQLLRAEEHLALKKMISTLRDLQDIYEHRGVREIRQYWRVLFDQKLAEDMEQIMAQIARDYLSKFNNDYFLRWGKYEPHELMVKKKIAKMLGDILEDCGQWSKTLVELRTLSQNLVHLSTRNRSSASSLDATLDLAKAFRMNGKNTIAIELLEEAFQIVRRKLPCADVRVLAVLWNLADCYIENGDHGKAESLLKQSTAAIEPILPEIHPERIKVLLLHGRHMLAVGQTDESIKLLKQLLSVSSKNLGKDNYTTLIVANELALALCLKGDYKNAEYLFEQNKEAQKRNQGPLHRETLIAYHNLGLLYLNQGNFMKAEKEALSAYNGFRDGLGEFHFQAGSTISLLAAILAEKGEYQESAIFWRKHVEWCDHNLDSEKLLKTDSLHKLGEALINAGCCEDALEPLYECLEARKRIYGDAHTSTLETIARILDSLISLERTKEALILSEMALEDIVRVHGSDHQKVFNQLINQVVIYERSGDIDSAISYGQRCLDGRERLLGLEDPSTLDSMNLMGNLYRTRGEYGQSESYYLRCLEGRERLFGLEDRETLFTRTNLAGLLKEKGDYERAESVYRDCLDVSERLLGPEHFETLEVVYDLADTLSDVGRNAESIPLRRRELAWSRKQNGNTNSDTLHSINQLAIDLRETGALEEAETLFRELVAARQEVLEPADFDIGRALGGLAKTLAAAGKLDEALSFAQQCLDHRLEHEGPESWHTNADRLDLARVLHQLGRSSDALNHLDLIGASVTSTPELDDDYQRLLADARELRESINGSS